MESISRVHVESSMLCRTGGDLSGASQPHKHLQLIPVEDDGPPVERLARKTKIDFPGRLLRDVHSVFTNAVGAQIGPSL